MSRSESMPVSTTLVEADNSEWGNALPILHEIRHGLQRLVDSGEPTMIDLQAIPFGPGDEDRLLSLLGHGEVAATLDALGPTHIRETSVPGVWLIDHRNASGERIGLQVEISTIPDILCTQPEDLRGAVSALDARMTADTDAATKHSPDD